MRPTTPSRAVSWAGAAGTAVVAAVVTLAVVPAPASSQPVEPPPPPPEEPSATTTTEAEAARPSFRGRLRFEGDPVEGVEIVVTRDDETVGSGTTNADGEWQVFVPSPGQYDVSVETDTLPEGVSLRDEDRQTLSGVPVRTGQEKSVIFALGERARGGPSATDRLVNLAFDGLVIGSIIAMASVGLSLIFGITGLVNFAHGELVTFGALIAWYFNASAADFGVPLVFAAVLAVGAGGAFGFGLERGLWRPLRRRRTGLIQMLVVSIGLSLFLRHVFLIFFGPVAKPFGQYAVQRSIEIGPISSPPKDFWVVAISLALLVGVGVLLQKTRLGTAMRAVADNSELAEASGIDVQKIILVTWVAGTALAAVGGVFQGMTESVSWLMGFRLLLLMFAAVILGGLGTAYGAMVGGILIGVVTQVSTYWIESELKLAVALGVLIMVLLVRPQGILGQRERVG